MPGPILLIAQQRSGTNMFRRALATTGWFQDRDEIFHHRPELGVYWQHRALMIAHQPKLSIPHSKHQDRIFASFLKTYAASERVHTLLDVKYNSLHSLNTIWQTHSNRPHLFNYLAARKIPVIHLIRCDILATFVSTIISREMQLFVSPNDIQLRKTWALDTAQLIHFIKTWHLNVSRTRNWLNNCLDIPCLELEYENLLNEQGDFRGSVLRQLESFLKIPERLEPKVVTRKMVKRPYWELVENFESEIVPLLINKGYAHLLPDHVRPNRSMEKPNAA